MSASEVASWLDYLAGLSNQHLDFTTSFEQARYALQNLAIDSPAPYIIVVTGTNGKGSVVAAIEQLAITQGYRVGATASPHVESYNERIRLQGQPISDSSLCRAFEYVAQHQGDCCLNYFQFSFLAALVAFVEADLDLVVLEVGVGGRLDACNLLEHQQTIITNIALDHCDKLGYTRDAIAREKADLIRPLSPVILGEQSMPEVIYEIAHKRQSDIYQKGYQFDCEAESQNSWQWYSNEHQVFLNPPNHLWNHHIAVALQAWQLFDSTSLSKLPSNIFQNVYLPGRQELCRAHQRQWLLDVAHNPSAARALSHYIQRLKTNLSGQVRAVLAMRSDKDVNDCIQQLKDEVDDWWVVDGQAMGLASSDYLSGVMKHNHLNYTIIDKADNVVNQLIEQSNEKDLIVTFGSFILVGVVKQQLRRGSRYGTAAQK